MNKKILSVLVLFLLCACANNKDIEPEIKYIDPINSINIFDELEEADKEILKKANGNNSLSNYQFKMIGKQVFSEDLIDIYYNPVNLNDYDKFVLEFVSPGCDHCRKMINDHLSKMLDSGITLIQYFNTDNNVDIFEMYSEIGIDIPDNLIICYNSDSFINYARYDLHLELFPTLIAYENGKVNFCVTGELNNDELDSFYSIGFNKTVDFEKYSELIKSCRDANDVKDSLGKENLELIKSINDEEATLNQTINIIGSKLDFSDIDEVNNTTYINEINDYSKYENSDLVIIYTYLSDPNQVDKVRFINKIIDSNSELEYIVVLIEGMENSGLNYALMSENFNCPCVSVLASVPRAFHSLGFSSYPSLLFVEKSTFVGAVSGLNEIDEFSKACDIFFGENSVARINR